MGIFIIILFGLKAIRINSYSRDMNTLTVMTPRLTKSDNLWLSSCSDQSQLVSECVGHSPSPCGALSTRIRLYRLGQFKHCDNSPLHCIVNIRPLPHSLFAKSCGRNMGLSPITLHICTFLCCKTRESCRYI